MAVLFRDTFTGAAVSSGAMAAHTAEVPGTTGVLSFYTPDKFALSGNGLLYTTPNSDRVNDICTFSHNPTGRVWRLLVEGIQGWSPAGSVPLGNPDDFYSSPSLSFSVRKGSTVFCAVRIGVDIDGECTLYSSVGFTSSLVSMYTELPLSPPFDLEMFFDDAFVTIDINGQRVLRYAHPGNLSFNADNSLITLWNRVAISTVQIDEVPVRPTRSWSAVAGALEVV